jgi:hypothetical protein
VTHLGETEGLGLQEDQWGAMISSRISRMISVDDVTRLDYLLVSRWTLGRRGVTPTNDVGAEGVKDVGESVTAGLFLGTARRTSTGYNAASRHP